MVKAEQLPKPSLLRLQCVVLPHVTPAPLASANQCCASRPVGLSILRQRIGPGIGKSSTLTLTFTLTAPATSDMPVSITVAPTPAGPGDFPRVGNDPDRPARLPGLLFVGPGGYQARLR